MGFWGNRIQSRLAFESLFLSYGLIAAGVGVGVLAAAGAAPFVLVRVFGSVAAGVVLCVGTLLLRRRVELAWQAAAAGAIVLLMVALL